MARRAKKQRERFSAEQKAWIARARAAPYQVAARETRAIVLRLQANTRRAKP
jgi:hypothetical protein